jgi:hypothetical protein
MHRYIIGIFIVCLATTLAGCACKLTPAQMSKNAEQIDRNADFILKKVQAGELPSVEWAKSHKELTTANKKLAEAGNE